MDTSLFIVAQLELVMINVPSASKLAPTITFELFQSDHCLQHAVLVSVACYIDLVDCEST